MIVRFCLLFLLPFCSALFSEEGKTFFDDIAIIPDSTPNYTEDATDFLHHHLSKQPRIKIFQFGTGRTTLWLAQRCRNINCVEDDLYRYKQLQVTLKHNQLEGNVRCHFMTRPYDKICEQFSDGEFDLILIEGTSRMRCLKESIRILKKGGIIVLNDAQRPHYAKMDEYVKGWQCFKTYQKKPDPIYHDAGRQTYWWIKP